MKAANENTPLPTLETLINDYVETTTEAFETSHKGTLHHYVVRRLYNWLNRKDFEHDPYQPPESSHCLFDSLVEKFEGDIEPHMPALLSDIYNAAVKCKDPFDLNRYISELMTKLTLDTQQSAKMHARIELGKSFAAYYHEYATMKDACEAAYNTHTHIARETQAFETMWLAINSHAQSVNPSQGKPLGTRWNFQ